jgi:fructose-1,6-bisphosphatase/sedoheptulose 1,7-bisphosphatase-like protein
MDKSLRYNIADNRLAYKGRHEPAEMTRNKLSTFNLRHQEVLGFYGLELVKGTVYVIDDRVNGLSNLGVFRSKQLRQAVVLASALPAAAVVLNGFGGLNKIPKEQQDSEITNKLKRMNDRTASQVMSEVLQITTETLDVGEEVIIESAFTEGVRVKPGVELGANPTLPVGALFGKEKDCKNYGHALETAVTRLSMGSDAIDGTTKSVKGLHSSLTALFITESGAKRHLPDIYVERWMAGVPFPEFNPRDTTIEEEAEIISQAYGLKNYDKLSAFFLDRPRHHPAMTQLNGMGVATPFDKDGDLFPAVVMGLRGLEFPDRRGLNTMIGEIGGSAEWAVGVLPLVWRGGQALGMLTSQSSLTSKDLSPEELWKERFHYTEEELMLIHDARFEQKPFFTIRDILEKPFAGGISAFSAISDNYFFPALEGVKVDEEAGTFTTNTIMINSLGVVEHWRLTFKCREGLKAGAKKLSSPKEGLRGLDKKALEAKIMEMSQDLTARFRLKYFFVNEYYPAIIHSGGRMVVLLKTLKGIIESGTMHDYDYDIVLAVMKAAPEWFISAV